MKLPAGNTLYYIALATGLLINSFFLVFLVGQSLAELMEGKTGVIPVLILMLMGIAGYLLAWRHVKKGGWIMISGGSGLIVYMFITGGIQEYRMALVFGLPYVVCGIFFLFVKRYTG